MEVWTLMSFQEFSGVFRSFQEFSGILRSLIFVFSLKMEKGRGKRTRQRPARYLSDNESEPHEPSPKRKTGRPSKWTQFDKEIVQLYNQSNMRSTQIANVLHSKYSDAASWVTPKRIENRLRYIRLNKLYPMNPLTVDSDLRAKDSPKPKRCK
jgi:hypothetical protein